MPTMPQRDREKLTAAQAAAQLVRDGDRVGLGTGSTVAYLLPALAARGLSIRCTATSPATERAARELGLDVEPLDEIAPLDITIDGIDQVDPAGWLIKGGGGAHTREKIIAAAAKRFVVIASHEKRVDHLTPPVPLEILAFGVQTTLRALGEARLRPHTRPSPDGGLIADWWGEIGDPAELAARLSAQPGVVEHGLFEPDMVSEVLVAYGSRRVVRLPGGGGTPELIEAPPGDGARG
jgi:ribose 5-phosphate isomerase A